MITLQEALAFRSAAQGQQEQLQRAAARYVYVDGHFIVSDKWWPLVCLHTSSHTCYWITLPPPTQTPFREQAVKYNPVLSNRVTFLEGRK